MPVYPPSPFESAVGGFLQGYNTTSGIRQRKQEAALQKRQADRADQLAQVQLGQQGYDVIQMPKIEAPPDQNLFQKVGFWLQHRNDEPQSIVMKTHPSVHETDVQNQEMFARERDAAHAQLAQAIAQANANAAAARAAETQKNENARNAASNAARLQAARISASARGPSSATGLVHAATAVNQQIMQKNRELTAAQRVKDAGLSRRATPADSAAYNAAVGGIPHLMAQRDSLQGVYGGIAARMQGEDGGGAPLSDADLWEQLVAQGLSADEATAQVNARHKK